MRERKNWWEGRDCFRWHQFGITKVNPGSLCFRGRFEARRKARNDSNQDDSEAGESELDEYDFEAGFQKRMKKEGGEQGLKVKAAKQSVDSVTRGVARSVDSVTRDVTGSVQSKLFPTGKQEGLVSNTDHASSRVHCQLHAGRATGLVAF